MGNFSAWSYSQRLTIWPVTTNEYSEPVVGTPYTVNGSYREGGQASRDDEGNEFLPRATYWFEGTGDQKPGIQWYIVRGELSGDPPTGAELIRRVIEHDVTLFQSGSLADYEVHT